MVRLRSKSCPTPAEWRSGDPETGRSGPPRPPQGDVRVAAGVRAVNLAAGECGAKDQVSRMMPMFDGRDRTIPAVAVPNLRADVLKEAELQIAIRHGKVEVSPTLRAAVEEKVGRVGRFFDGMERAEVRFVEEHNPRIAAREVCEVTIVGHGHVVRARASATDAFAAVDRVVDKLEHQMTKLKGKLVSRSHPRRNGAVNGAVNDSVIEAAEPVTMP